MSTSFRSVTVEDLLALQKTSETLTAKKSKPVTARAAVPGEEITTLVENPAGGVLEETKNKASEVPSMVVTNMIDGQTNSWIVKKETFDKRYTADPNQDGKFLPVGAPVEGMFRTKENITFQAPWGSPINLAAGGVVVPDPSGGFYGINPKEFEATYDILKTTPAEVQSKGRLAGLTNEATKTVSQGISKAPQDPGMPKQDISGGTVEQSEQSKTL